MKKIKISSGENLEICKLMPDGRIETIIGEVANEGNTRSFILKVFKRMVFSPTKMAYDLVEIKSTETLFFWKQLFLIKQRQHAFNFSVEGIDDGEY
ncbi:MAG: hypothetical protein WCT42_00310 [Candidatus Paceibacterota bacterium]